jgi:hypothetical protein
MENAVKLSIGLVINGQDIKELPLAETGAEAEKIYSEKPKQTSLYDWFSRIVAVSIESIGGVPVAEEFIKSGKVPDVVKKIPFLDLGGLVIQIQRGCWEETINDQRFKCTHCGTTLETDIELNKIEIPTMDGEVIQEYRVKIPQTITIDTEKLGSEDLKEFHGQKFNQLVFRVATIHDALKHQAIIKDELKFWRDIAFDTLTNLELVDEEGNVVDVIGSRYVSVRAKALFSRDFNTKALKAVRKGLQTALPTAKYYYEDACYDCGEQTPFFASVNSFFTV